MPTTIALLGGFEVGLDGRSIPAAAWTHRRGAELVKLLALAPARRLHREQLMDTMWPDLDSERAAANLRKAVFLARQVLGDPAAVTVDGGVVQLWPDDEVWIDVHAFSTAAHAALGSTDTNLAAGLAAAAVRLYTGDLLPDDRMQEWTEPERGRLRLLLQQLLKKAGMFEQAAELDPLDEQAHRAVMNAALARGDRRAAMRQFELLRERLRTDLGIAPEVETVHVYERALALEGSEPPTPTEQAQAALAWGLVHLNQGDLAEAEAAAKRARGLAIDNELGGELGEASALLGLVANMQGRWPELFRTEFTDSVRRSPAMAAFVFEAHLCLAEFSLVGPGGHTDVADYAAELLDVAQTAGSDHGAGLALLLLGEIALFSGDLDHAEQLLGRAAALHAAASSAAGRAIAMQRLAEAALARGDRSRVSRCIADGMAFAASSHLTPHLYVRLHATRIDASATPRRAVEELRRADNQLDGAVVCHPCSMGYELAAAKALATAGQISSARGRLETAERLSAMWRGGPWVAGVWEARALLRRAQGEPAQAAALLREAAQAYAEFGRPLDRDRCLASAGILVR